MPVVLVYNGTELTFELPERAARTCGFIANMIDGLSLFSHIFFSHFSMLDGLVAAATPEENIKIPIPGPTVSEEGLRKVPILL
jgi:hypothetical protein